MKTYASNYEGKAAYVSECLEPAIIGMDSSWESLVYDQHYQGSDVEVVVCTNKNPDKTIAVNVTCDSIQAIFWDVTNTIKTVVGY